VRRVLLACAVMALGSIAVAIPQKQSSSSGYGAPLVVLAQGISARALALGPGDSVFASLANPANRAFALGFSSASSPASLSPALNLIAGTGVVGSLGDGGAASSAQLNLESGLLYQRSGIAVASDGAVYIADTGNSTIRRIAGPASTEPGVIRSVAGRWAARQSITLSRPLGVALDRAGNLYIADQTAGALDVLRQDNGVLATLAQVSSPASVAVTADGAEAFVASPENGSVFALDLPQGSLRAVTGLNKQPQSAENPPCSSGSNQVCPAGLALDGAGNLFVSDTTFGRIIRVDAHTGKVTSAITNLHAPGAIAFDQQGRDLYISEQGLDRLVKAEGMGDPVGNLSISPGSWAFANEPTGGVSAQEQFTVTNNTTSSLTGIALAFQPTAPAKQADFTQESSSCLATLAAGASCTVNVSSTPTSVGALTSALSVTDTAGDSASSTLTGTGDDYQLQLASGQTQEVSVIEGDLATFHLQVQALGVFGANNEQVSLYCPGDVPENTTCTVTPPSISPAVSSTTAFTITIQTNSTATLSSRFNPAAGFRFAPPRDPPAIIGLLAICLLGIAFAWRTGARWLALPALFVVALALLSGCHSAAKTNRATPVGVTQILIQGSALTKTGAPLNATRATTIILDVLKN
jgi:sugar lactone lactonase YvrE